jgi:hypothetical protein
MSRDRDNASGFVPDTDKTDEQTRHNPGYFRGPENSTWPGQCGRPGDPLQTACEAATPLCARGDLAVIQCQKTTFDFDDHQRNVTVISFGLERHRVFFCQRAETCKGIRFHGVRAAGAAKVLQLSVPVHRFHASVFRNDAGDFQKLQSLIGRGCDAASTVTVIFHRAEDDTQLQSRISILDDLYQQAVNDRGFQDQGSSIPAGQFSVNPLSCLADGLVKSLGKIDAARLTPKILDSYVTAVEHHFPLTSPAQSSGSGNDPSILRENRFATLLTASRSLVVLRLSLNYITAAC